MEDLLKRRDKIGTQLLILVIPLTDKDFNDVSLGLLSSKAKDIPENLDHFLPYT
jgi:hypothetical protein